MTSTFRVRAYVNKDRSNLVKTDGIDSLFSGADFTNQASYGSKMYYTPSAIFKSNLLFQAIS